MEQIHASALEAENKVRTLETDGMRLKLYQDMLTNISTQATLLLGFSLSTYGADMLPVILDDTSSFCFYKDGWTMFFGAIFLLNNTANIGFCLLVILFSSYFILKSQTALLYVGGSAAVWRTHQLCYYVYRWYGYSLCVFILNAMLLMWIFLGFGLWRTVEPDPSDAAGGGWDVETKLGHKLIRCLDLESDDHHASRDWFGKINAVISQMTFGAFIWYGWNKFNEFERSFNVDALHGSDAVRREEQEERAREQLSVDLKMAHIRHDEATKEIKKLRRLETELAKWERNLEKADKKVDKARDKYQADADKRRELILAEGGMDAAMLRARERFKKAARVKINFSRAALRRAQGSSTVVQLGGAASPDGKTPTRLFSPDAGPRGGPKAGTPQQSIRAHSPPLQELLKTASKPAPDEQDSMC